MAIGNPVFVLLLLAQSLACRAQDTIISPEQYIQTYKDLAVSEMHRTGIPASITLAQGLYESGNGNSFLAKPPYNNHFGIKCKGDWTGRTVKVDDDELQECFRAYDKAEDSYKDHSNFLSCQPRYASLFKLDPTDYKGWAYGLKAAGYATNPKYPEKLIERIEKYALYQYDSGNTKQPPNILAQNETPDSKAKPEPKKEDAFTFNNIPAYVIKSGDDYQSIANQYNMMRWEIRKYNDLKLNEPLTPSTIIYLKPKHRKGQNQFHSVKDGEGMYYISQSEGIKLRMLYKWNRMKEGQEPAPGQQLNLRKKRESAPAMLAPGTVLPRHGVMLVPKPATGPKPDFNKCPPRGSDTVTGLPPKTINQSVKDYPDPVEAEDGTDSMGRYHIAQKGETVYGISKNYGLSYKKVIAWNNLKGTVQAGQKIYLAQPVNFTKAQTEPEKTTIDNSIDSQTDTAGTYTVKPGDTLYGISRRFKVSVDQLKTWNGMADNTISIGQTLKTRP